MFLFLFLFLFLFFFCFFCDAVSHRQAPKLKIIAQRPEGKQSKVNLQHPSSRNTRVVELERPGLDVPFGLDLKIIKEKDLFGYGSMVTVKTLTPDGLAATAGLHTVRWYKTQFRRVPFIAALCVLRTVATHATDGTTPSPPKKNTHTKTGISFF